MALAAHYDLSNPNERKRSNANLVDLFETLILILKPVSFLEIGAFSAAFSQRIKKKAPDLVIHAYEANPKNLQGIPVAPRGGHHLPAKSCMRHERFRDFEGSAKDW